MKGKRVVVIENRLSTIRKMDRIIVVNEGKIVEAGDHNTLLLNEGGLYKKLWTLQAGGFILDQSSAKQPERGNKEPITGEDRDTSEDNQDSVDTHRSKTDLM